MVVEGLQGQLFTRIVERRVLPAIVDLFERDVPGAVDRVYQPDIAVEQHGGIALR